LPLLLTTTVLPLLVPLVASSSAAATVATISDPAGDAPSRATDVLAASMDYQAESGRLVLTATLAEPTSATTVEWRVGQQSGTRCATDGTATSVVMSFSFGAPDQAHGTVDVGPYPGATPATRAIAIQGSATVAAGGKVTVTADTPLYFGGLNCLHVTTSSGPAGDGGDTADSVQGSPKPPARFLSAWRKAEIPLRPARLSARLRSHQSPQGPGRAAGRPMGALVVCRRAGSDRLPGRARRRITLDRTIDAAGHDIAR
jgi:hypothetical protein